MKRCCWKEGSLFPERTGFFLGKSCKTMGDIFCFGVAKPFLSYEGVEWLHRLSTDPHSDDDTALEVNKDTSTFIPTDPEEVLPSHSRTSFTSPADPNHLKPKRGKWYQALDNWITNLHKLCDVDTKDLLSLILWKIIRRMGLAIILHSLPSATLLYTLHYH